MHQNTANERCGADGEDRPDHEKDDLRVDTTHTVAAHVDPPGIELDADSKNLQCSIHLRRQLHLVDGRDERGDLRARDAIE